LKSVVSSTITEILITQLDCFLIFNFYYNLAKVPKPSQGF
jgi:hypothetical protein